MFVRESALSEQKSLLSACLEETRVDGGAQSLSREWHLRQLDYSIRFSKACSCAVLEC